MTPETYARLEDWSVTTLGVHHGPDSGFTAPELMQRHIRHIKGAVFGSPKHADGSVVTLTRVVAVGRFVQTKTGHWYRLGEPADAYRKFLSGIRPDWDPENPYAVRSWSKKL